MTQRMIVHVAVIRLSSRTTELRMQAIRSSRDLLDRFGGMPAAG